MTIRQERMITLINAAVAYRELAYYASTLLTQLVKSTPTDDAKLALAQLEFALIEAARHDECISGERDSFARNQRRNERERIKMANKRRLRGVQQRKHTERLNEASRILHTGAERGDQYARMSDDTVNPDARADIDKFVKDQTIKEEQQAILNEELREQEEARQARTRPRQPLTPSTNTDIEEEG